MSRWALTGEIMLRMIGYGAGYGTLSGGVFGSSIFLPLVVATFASPLWDERILPVIGLCHIALLYGGILGLMAGLCLGFVVGIVLSIVTAAFSFVQHTQQAGYYKLIAIATSAICAVTAGVYKIIFVDRYYQDMLQVARIVWLIVPPVIATFLCCRAARKVSQYAAEQLKLP